MAEISIATVKKFNPDAQVVVVSEQPLQVNGVDKYFIYSLDKEHRRRKATDRITNAAYLKCVLPDILPYGKVIYLDPDVECLAPLNELWEMPCKYINLCESHNYGKLQAEALGLKKYALTGMMVMNLSNLRDIHFSSRCFDIEKMDIPKKWWKHDETCIQLAMRGNLTFIDKKWNYCKDREYDEPVAPSDVKLLHYVGASNKPAFTNLAMYENLAEIKDSIKGKSVAIVGNAQSIFEVNNGDKIDAADFVIRFNRGFITKPESQGTKTDMVILACLPTEEEIKSYGAKFIVNRSKSYINPMAQYTIGNKERARLRDRIGKQPSSGFMAIDLCLTAGAKSITLFGFDFGKTQTFYNDPNYITQHDYNTEEKIVLDYVKNGLVKVEW